MPGTLVSNCSFTRIPRSVWMPVSRVNSRRGRTPMATPTIWQAMICPALVSTPLSLRRPRQSFLSRMRLISA